MTAGEKIKASRKLMGLTQKELSDRIGVSIRYIQDIENGRKKCTDIDFRSFSISLGCEERDLKDDAPKGMVDPANDDFGAVCNCAVRYCLGRRSYMPSLICRYIIPLLPELTDETLDCFERDIAERKKDGFNFGDSCDYETWDTFYKAVCKEIEGRKGNGSQID